jgi:hypothetical protein
MRGSVLLSLHTSSGRSSPSYVDIARAVGHVVCSQLPPQKTGLDRKAVRMGFVLDKVTVQEGFLRALRYSTNGSRLSSVEWTVGPLGTAVLQRQFHPITRKEKRQILLEPSQSIAVFVEHQTSSTFNLRSALDYVNSSVMKMSLCFICPS